MNHWQDFMETQGVRRLPGGGIELADDAGSPPRGANWMTELGHQSLLWFEGPDAEKFLQGQVTCDLRALEAGHWAAGAQCNLKGRVIASFTLARQTPDSILLRTSADLLNTLHASLSKYAVFSKVDLTPAADQWRLMGLSGPNAGALIEKHTGLPAPDIGKSAASDSALILRLDSERYELWVKDDAAPSIWQALADHCQLTATSHWQQRDIAAGWAHVVAATSETFTPQDLNYQLIGAVSFKKGCYTGQEVVARLHYKAKLKKHLYRVDLELDRAPEPGTALVDARDKARGQVVQAAVAGPHAVEALAVLPANLSEPLTLEHTEVQAQPLDLPYDIPRADD